MTLFEAALLGIVQGLTEFLPVSSSGHLVIGRHLLGAESVDSLAFDVALHCGTMVAVLVYFRADIARLARAPFMAGQDYGADRRELGMLILASVPIAATGLLFSDLLAPAFQSPLVAGYGLLTTAALLASARFVPGTTGPARRLGPREAIVVGLFQALAIMPGVSRAGATIVAGLWVGLERGAAARFAFLLALPAIAGATLLNLGGISGLASSLAPTLVTGVLLAALSGLLAISVMMRAVQGGRLLPFALYCLALGTAALVVGVG